MCNYIVTSEEILRAERDVLGDGLHFNDKQKLFLKCLDSCCLQAYAGTGKTSSIVGKLHILAQKNIWQNGRGICVISHTNVAVDEIKKHVARHYPEVMAYPNFVGTIQEFVNKFLFVPYLASKKLRIKFQDESRYFDYKNELKDQVVIQRITNALKTLNHSQNVDAKRDFFERLSTIHLNAGKVFARKQHKGVTEYTDLQTKKVSQDIIANALTGLIQEQHNKGVFLFIESFIYGYEFLQSNPILKDIISHRFQFIFLDEAQDCSEVQLNLLNELFQEKANTIFQQIGDVNQAISETQWKADDDPLCLGESTRFGQNIVDFINTFRIDNGAGLTGKTKATQRILITYDLGKEDEVLPKFAKLLKDKKIPLEPEKGYFAISHKHDQLCKYFPTYSEQNARNKTKKSSYRFDSDIEYLDLMSPALIRENGSHFVSNVLFSLLYKYFKQGGDSWVELREYLRNGVKSSEFKELVIQITIDVLQNVKVSDLVGLKRSLDGILGENKVDFSGAKLQNRLAVTVALENKFTSADSIVVNVNTIHSVKGQTHNATLFFSNSEYSKQDIQHVLDNTPKRTPDYKKLLYVASSRAKYLFAFAISKSAYDGLTNKNILSSFVVEHASHFNCNKKI